MALPSATLVAFADENDAPEGRESILRRVYLYRLRGAKRVFGKRYYMTWSESPASQTWLTDEKAAAFKQRSVRIPRSES